MSNYVFGILIVIIAFGILIYGASPLFTKKEITPLVDSTEMSKSLLEADSIGDLNKQDTLLIDQVGKNN